MKKSEVHTGMIVEIWSPYTYFLEGYQINGRVIALVMEKYDTYCSVEIYKNLNRIGITRNIQYKDLGEHKTQGTKWWM